MNSRAIADGLRLAAGLKVPLKIAGKPVFVSDEIAASLAVESPAPVGEAERSSSLPSLTETARAIAWILRQAEHELETVGIESGILKAAAPSPSSHAAKPAVLAHTPQPPARFDVQEQLDGSVTVNGLFSIRTSDQKSWHVVEHRQGRDELRAWHESQMDALLWVRAELAGKHAALPPTAEQEI